MINTNSISSFVLNPSIKFYDGWNEITTIKSLSLNFGSLILYYDEAEGFYNILKNEK